MAKAAHPTTWMPFYWGDYLRDTLHLDTEAHGAYFLLIAAYWCSGGPLEDRNSDLAAITKLAPGSWRKHRRQLARFFEIRDGLWCHKRIDEELARAKHLTEVRQTAGKAGGKAKANGKQNPTQSQSQSPLPSQSDRSDLFVLSEGEIDKGRAAAPGYDIYYIQEAWKAWNQESGKVPDRPGAAFLGFTKKYVRENPL